VSYQEAFDNTHTCTRTSTLFGFSKLQSRCVTNNSMVDQSTQIIFRRASTIDIDQLVELRIRQLLDEGYPEVTDIRRDLSKYFLTNIENGSLICWVGVTDEILLATAGICFYQLPPTFSNPSGRIAYITNMYTDPPYSKILFFIKNAAV